MASENLKTLDSMEPGLTWADLISGVWLRMLALVRVMIVGMIAVSIIFGLGLDVIGTDRAIAVSMATLDKSQPKIMTNPTVLSSDDVSSEKLNQFVVAYWGVMDSVERREMAWQSAESEAEALRIQEEVEQDALDAIEQAGLSSVEYRQLLNLAQVDDELGETIDVLLQDYTIDRNNPRGNLSPSS